MTVIEDCLGQAISLLVIESEKNIFQRHPFTHQFLDCNSNTLGLEAVIHEATHFEDLGVPAGFNEKEVEIWLSKASNVNFNLFLIDNSKRGEIEVNQAPEPQESILSFLKEYYPNILSDESHTIQSFLNLYIRDLATLSSYSFSKGLVTELNAYTHGLMIEQRLKLNTHELLSQRYGILSFLFFFKAYLFELKNHNPSLWNGIIY